MVEAETAAPVSNPPRTTAAELAKAVQGYLWTWQSPTADTLVCFRADGTLLTREKQVSQWEALDHDTLRVTYPNQQTVTLTFDSEATRYLEEGSASGLIRGLRQKSLAPVADTPRPDQVHAADKLNPKPGEMALYDPWIPSSLYSRKVLLQSLAEYSRKVLQSTSGTPEKIWSSITWLMPIGDALATLPKGSYKLRSDRANRLCFPEGLSIHFWHIGGNLGILDRGEVFDEIHFITDALDRVISVQLHQKNAKDIVWAGIGPDGSRNPYFNFLYDRSNSSSSRSVWYEIRNAGRGVGRIKTVLGRESNHWYLTAPLADKFLEIELELSRQ
ncbi:hypothetical protein [Prosthecobacter fusiformis]|nr:hypothetical protein [Prosthecobacter fusiformis]